MRTRAARTLLGCWRWGILAVATAAIALTAGGGEQGRPAIAGDIPQVDMNLAILSQGNVVNTCDKLGGDYHCRVRAGRPFTVTLFLDQMSGLPNADADAKQGYTAFAAHINWSSGLTRVDSSGLSEVVWPNCGVPGPEDSLVGDWHSICYVSGNESVFTGAMARWTFMCDDATPPLNPSIVGTPQWIKRFEGNGSSGGISTYLDDETGYGWNEVNTHFREDAALIIECDAGLVQDVNLDGTVTIADISNVVQLFGTCLLPTCP